MKTRRLKRNFAETISIGLLFACIWFSCFTTPPLYRCDQTDSIFGEQINAVFPKSLYYLGEEAFAGTSIESVVFESELTTIGNLAFAGTPLIDVYIPQSTKHIGNDAFPSESVVHGIINSYAETWAKERKYRFVSDNIWSTCIIPAEYHDVFCLFLFCILLPADFKKKYTIRKNIWALIRSMRPQDRIELYPINYRFP